jgi:hypothetical protein
MDAAAGWTMTPIELLQFLVRIDGSSMKADILQSDSINEMIRPTALSFYSYAKGWQVTYSTTCMSLNILRLAELQSTGIIYQLPTIIILVHLPAAKQCFLDVVNGHLQCALTSEVHAKINTQQC